MMTSEVLKLQLHTLSQFIGQKSLEISLALVFYPDMSLEFTYIDL